MMDCTQDVSDIANELLEGQWNLTHFEALQIAAKIQFTEALKEALIGFTGDYPIAETLQDISSNIDLLVKTITQ